MAEGRSIALMVLLCMLVLYSEMVYAETYVVGDAAGWTFNSSQWPNGKSFKAGDVLEFHYPPLMHDVVQVDECGYNTCFPILGRSTFHLSGNDRIVLSQGMNYFICAVPFHCLQGMKMAINAA
ncbi:basic blue protein [Cajanus cajan]|uniref:Basic blue protein n=1 Tax=Cajanus cajan TaxID=3821 RepID=A0A151R9N8_CAJCA|nr:basic blue protein [Cajanus cajan]KYP39257.1 Basic blue protein [Cajanus cajan]